MEKNIKISILLDFYKELLTAKQADALELYYNQDLSLGEISEHLNITRQGVRDSIKRGERQLLELENKLKIAERFNKIQKHLENIMHTLQQADDINRDKLCSSELNEKIINIKTSLDTISNMI